MKKKILAVGEILWDVYPDRKTIGGAPLNFAAHAVRCGAESALLSAVGDDGLGRDAVRALGDFGVATRYVQQNGFPTGQCTVRLDGSGLPVYEILRDTAYDRLTADEEVQAHIAAEHFDALCFGTLVQRSPISRRAVRAVAEKCPFGEIFCDVNLREDCYDADSVTYCLSHATILKISMEEEPAMRALAGYLPGENTPCGIAEAIAAAYRNIKIVLVTLGKDGSFAYNAVSGDRYRQPSVGDTVVSTVGAGDSFSAAWLTGYLTGEPLERCMKRAAAVSGIVVAHKEAVPDYVLPEEYRLRAQ